MTHCWSQNMYFLNLVWLEDPAGGGDRQSPVHAALTPSLYFYRTPWEQNISLCTAAWSTYLQASAFLVFTHNILSFFFFLFPLFVIRFVPYAGKNGGHKIFWEFFGQLEKGTIRKKRGENSVMTFSFFCSFK